MEYPAILTAEELELMLEEYNPSSVADAALNRKMEYPLRPTKPTLAGRPTADAARAYADALEQYDILDAQYTAQTKRVNQHNSEVDKELKKFLIQSTGLAQFPSKVVEATWDKVRLDMSFGDYNWAYNELLIQVELYELVRDNA